MPSSTEASRPLRSDALRNRALLIDAARELFAERGVDVALEEVARRAGVSIGTLYNRFPTRAALIEAVFADRLEKIAGYALAALADPDPWHGFADYLVNVCELQAVDRGFNEVAARGLADSPANQGLRRQVGEAMNQLIERAKQAGAVRADLAMEDLAFVVWGIAQTVERTANSAPRLWRRHLALLLDGFRAEGAHPLPEPPLRPDQSHAAVPECDPPTK
ncbi:MAG TPA: helix-turn-helix domain-containing protein [Pseudonocardiaceae bacterium]|jgi:AcrR family transcriptional regulator|nr:helix-turn-helix domain-containing protein [Pseudonocardiaceae bacterium]